LAVCLHWTISKQNVINTANAKASSIVLLEKGIEDMASSLSRTCNDIAEIYDRHKDMIYRICFAFMKNRADTEDILQETFISLIKADTIFASSEHEKAWLIRTASNLCKNNLRHWWRKRENIEDYEGLQTQNEFEIDETFKVVMSLPDKYKTVVYLYYYEGYDSVEISEILGKPQSTIRYFLSNARKILRTKLGGDFDEK